MSTTPINLVFEELDDHIVIYTIAHTKRKPGYWRELLGDAVRQCKSAVSHICARSTATVILAKPFQSPSRRSGGERLLPIKASRRRVRRP